MTAPDAARATAIGRVGFVGLGSIGLPMANRLLDCGVTLHVHNRTPARADELRARGATWAASPAEVAGAAATIVTCLRDPSADRAVYQGVAGLLGADLAGRLVVNTSTIGPDVARELADGVVARGGVYVDAALMGGGPPSARRGDLVVPVAGPPDAVDRARPVLALLASTIERVGDVGAAQVVKLANNVQYGVAAASLAQAIRLALRAGVDPGALGRLLPLGSARSHVSESLLEPMLRGARAPGTSLEVVSKDVALAVALARTLGEDASVARAAWEMYERAVDQGLDGWGLASLVDVEPGSDPT